ncbi:hypothetical protein L596_030686 [Steinernema carpocapsae]|uniref:Uncharacterized protein n=1 Tax=Steinernema carpocapsae TaxID=34508 RepID=A0A4U5LQ44_STECR|nr:hypothetical protein L596_030678 [Steinernema carpocapsae]TKR58063.1 hypothetical protein L596_030686 [Steinernema carpocapsae]
MVLVVLLCGEQIDLDELDVTANFVSKFPFDENRKSNSGDRFTNRLVAVASRLRSLQSQVEEIEELTCDLVHH